jgi:cell wall-associated NlpC family hydrolase
MKFRRPDFAPEVIRAMQDHAVRAYPAESCGLVIAGAYVPCANLRAGEADAFRIDEAFYAIHEAEVEAVIHSHPNGPTCPTGPDMAGQIGTGKIWGIVPCQDGVAGRPLFWGDYRLEDPLLERPFIHGVTDCYGLIRSWYWQQRKLLLPEFPRGQDWWKDKADLYRDGYEKAGFIRIEEHQVRFGDVFLGQVRSPVPNHGGILLENGLVLHHLDHRLSAREPVEPYRKYITHWLRYAA